MLPQTSAEADEVAKKRAARPRVNAAEKYGVIKAIALALSRKSYPPMDERLKSIVASHVGTLLKGGWPATEIQTAAIELALAWDPKRGHNRLAHLASRVRAADAQRQREEHRERQRIETQELAGRAEPGMSMRHPNLHEYASDGKGSCSVCGGPVGVHVAARVDTRGEDELVNP